MNIKETVQERSIQAMKVMVEMRVITRGVGDGDWDEDGRVVKGNEANDARRVAACQVPTSLSVKPPAIRLLLASM